MSTTHELRRALEAIRGRRVLVVGDLYLDCYLFGNPDRVSREAPAMVLLQTRREARLGGGTAPALAVRALGGEVWQVGVVGDDDEGRTVRALLRERGVNTDGVLIDPSRPTTTKTRIVAEGAFNVFPQQIVRLDHQRRDAVAGPMAHQMAAFIGELAPSVDAILLSDYRSGVIVPEVIEAARDSGRLATVDSQGSLADFKGLALVKCNQHEAESYLGQPLTEREERERLLRRLRGRLDCERLVVTLGPEGAALVDGDGSYHEVPAAARRQVFDVTGAGDTVIAVMTGALAAGSDALTALRLAQVAAGLVIGMWGNAQASSEEIAAALDDGESPAG
jgi:rfaE bifunctional protein kinase chain/domain